MVNRARYEDRATISRVTREVSNEEVSFEDSLETIAEDVPCRVVQRVESATDAAPMGRSVAQRAAIYWLPEANVRAHDILAVTAFDGSSETYRVIERRLFHRHSLQTECEVVQA